MHKVNMKVKLALLSVMKKKEEIESLALFKGD